MYSRAVDANENTIRNRRPSGSFGTAIETGLQKVEEKDEKILQMCALIYFIDKKNKETIYSGSLQQKKKIKMEFVAPILFCFKDVITCV